MLNCLYCVKNGKNLKNSLVLFPFLRIGVGALDKCVRVVYVFIYFIGITSWEFVISIS